ncbi:MAG: manganese efflux pump MntP family protein [bacterium]
MGVIATLLLAAGLAMDAAAVSIGARASGRAFGRRAAFRLGFHFGLFQFLMPVLGWLAGSAFVALVAAVDHWVAFVLLAAIGGHMIWGGLHPERDAPTFDPSRGWTLIMLSIATSIDALAVGLSLAFLQADILTIAGVIGVVTAGLSALGFWLGARLGVVFGHRMTVAGGLVLLGVGIRILVEHLGG